MSALDLVQYELARAKAKYPPINSRHEGYAVILEELQEYWELCKQKAPHPQDLVDELVQVAAMALRTIGDVCDEDTCP